MKTCVFFEDESALTLLPLTYWRTVGELPYARHTLLRQAESVLRLRMTGAWVRDWIAPVAAERLGVPVNQPVVAGTLLVNASWVPDQPVVVPSAPLVGERDGVVMWIACDEHLASRLDPAVVAQPRKLAAALKNVPRRSVGGMVIRHPWDLLACAGEALDDAFAPIDAALLSTPAAAVTLVAAAHIHVGRGCRFGGPCVLDATNGPIYLEDGVEIGAFCVIEGPAYLGERTRINPHSRLHGANIIGPVCRLGGEIDGCIFLGRSNKQHAGFLGHAIVGEWVNLGAGTTNSDLKNTYGSVRAATPIGEIDTGRMFFGAVIADHVKLGIETALPTGCGIGFAAVVSGGGPCPKWIPSFAWRAAGEAAEADAARLLETARKAAVRREHTFTDAEQRLFLSLPAIAREHEPAAPARKTLRRT